MSPHPFTEDQLVKKQASEQLDRHRLDEGEPEVLGV